MSMLGRARLRTLRNVYGVGSPTVGSTSSSIRLHIYVPSHIDSRFKIFIDQFGPNEGHVNIHRYVYMTKIQMVKNEQERK